jgi:hypothetical protein
MFEFVICGIVVLAAVALWFLPKSSKKPHFKDIDDMMHYLAEEAVSIAGESPGIRLYYSENSIKDVEEALNAIHEQYLALHPEKGVMGLAMAYGAYIGEVMRRGYPGSKWEQDSSVMGMNSYPLHWLGGEIYPCAWCYGRIVNGPEDNVWHKYLMLKEPRSETR